MDEISRSVDSLRDAYFRATDDSEFVSIEDRVTKESAALQSLAAAVKQNLVTTKDENDKFSALYNDAENSASLEMRVNMYNLTARKFKAALETFQKSHNNFREEVKSRQKRRLQSVDEKKSLDDAAIDQIIENGQVSEVIRESLMNTASVDLRDCVSDIERRHAEVIALERSVRELFELFGDVATLVDIQEDNLKTIDKHITKAKGYVESGAQQLNEAEKHQQCSRKVLVLPYMS